MKDIAESNARYLLDFDFGRSNKYASTTVRLKAYMAISVKKALARYL